MKRTSMVALLLGLYFFPIAQTSGGVQTGKVVNPVLCTADGTQSYALYIPKKGNAKPMPVVFFFDPHGDGSLPLNFYKTLGEANGFILVGSNNSKNGNDWPTTEKIWNRLFADVRQRIKADDHRLYVCGFSGGAKVAGYIAIQHPGIRGVIAGGAGLPEGVSAGDLPFSFTALAGEGDMNLTDLAAISRELDRTKTRHRIILFDGKHEWAPLPVMDRAFAGWQLEAMQDGVLPRDAAFISGILAGDKSRVETAIRVGRLVRAEQDCRVATSFFEGLTPDAGWFRQKAAMLDGDPKYKKQAQEREALFAREETTKAEYMHQFQEGDNRYWEQTIKDLEARAALTTPEKGMVQRLLAYLSLAFYSISNQMINAGRNDGARHFVELYKLADPTNSEAWYLSAVVDVREGNIPAAGAHLQKAIGLGFRERERMRRQPEFQKAFSATELSRIDSKMLK